LGRTKGIAKFGGTLILLFVAASFLQGRGLIPTAGGLGGSLQNFLTKAKGAESGLETITPTNPTFTANDTIESRGTQGAGGTGAGFSIDPGSVFKQSGFKGLLEQFSVGPGKFGLFSSPLNLSIRKGVNLQTLGVSGIETTTKGITGLPLPPRAISLTRPTLFGSFTTPTGGTRIMRGSAGLFARRVAPSVGGPGSGLGFFA